MNGLESKMIFSARPRSVASRAASWHCRAEDDLNERSFACELSECLQSCKTRGFDCYCLSGRDERARSPLSFGERVLESFLAEKNAGSKLVDEPRSHKLRFPSTGGWWCVIRYAV